MARRREGNLRFGVLLLAVAISALLWGMAHGSSNIETGFDVPVELGGLNEDLVVTDLSHDAINIRIKGSRAAMRNVKADELTYAVDVSGAKAGTGEYEIPNAPVDVPNGARIVARSPADIQVRFERRGRKTVTIRADVDGEPEEGYLVTGVEVEPQRVWLAGARSQVLRLTEVSTEPVDISGATEPVEREARLFLGGGTVWMEDKGPVTVKIAIEPDPALAVDSEAAEGEEVAVEEEKTG